MGGDILTPPMTLSPGTQLGPYEIVSLLGSGGMGVVYEARDPRLDRRVAIKLLPPDLTRDETAKQRFLQEAKAASALDHPNICTIFEINETDDGQLYLVMAQLRGGDAQRKDREGSAETGRRHRHRHPGRAGAGPLISGLSLRHNWNLGRSVLSSPTLPIQHKLLKTSAATAGFSSTPGATLGPYQGGARGGTQSGSPWRVATFLSTEFVSPAQANALYVFRLSAP